MNDTLMRYIRKCFDGGIYPPSIARMVRLMPVLPYPPVLQIYLDSICNLKCFFCYTPPTKERFDIRNLRMLEQPIKHARSISISACGEPLLSPHLFAVLDKIYSWNNRSNLISIVTNGTILTSELARHLNGRLGDLSISLNASTSETYRRDMGKDIWGDTLERIRMFMDGLDVSEQCKVRLHMVAHKGNYREIPGLVLIANQLNISRVRVDQLMVTNADLSRKSLPNVRSSYNFAIERAIKLASDIGVSLAARRFGIKEARRICVSPWLESYVRVNGQVAPCCWNGDLFMGNAYDTSFEDVWTGEQYRHFRKHPSPLCLDCPRMMPFDDLRAHIAPRISERVGRLR